MFMILAIKGCAHQCGVRLPSPGRLNRGVFRHQHEWMSKMNAESAKLKCRFYAFRHQGQWHLCDNTLHDTPVKSIPQSNLAAAEMWVLHKEQARARA